MGGDDPHLGRVVTGGAKPVIEAPGGRRLFLNTDHPPDGAEKAQGLRFMEFALTKFEQCPICLVGGPVSKEHVPPKSIGGSCLTYTCLPCNNKFSASETALADLVLIRKTRIFFESHSVPGRRKARSIAAHLQEDGTPVWVIDNADEAIRDTVVIDRGFRLTFEADPRPLWRAASLKHAYLCACLLLGEVPASRDSDEVRAELLTYRTTDLKELGPWAKNLTAYRGFDMDPGSSLVAVADFDVPGMFSLMLQLAGFGYVAWPIPDLAHAAVDKLNEWEHNGTWVLATAREQAS